MPRVNKKKSTNLENDFMQALDQFQKSAVRLEKIGLEIKKQIIKISDESKKVALNQKINKMK